MQYYIHIDLSCKEHLVLQGSRVDKLKRGGGAGCKLFIYKNLFTRTGGVRSYIVSHIIFCITECKNLGGGGG